MLPFLQSAHGNASSLHQSGRFLRSAIETARHQVADLINASPQQVIFTSGGSEANNLAIKGFIEQAPGTTIVTSPIEHPSVLQPMRQLEQAGCALHWLGVTDQGVVDVMAAEGLIRQVQPELLSIQLANNETGAIQPVAQLAAMAHQAAGCLVHCDATQGIGKMDVDFQQLDVDLMTLSGHKFQGPQGVGALIVKNQTLSNPLISGGPQESDRRAGTENVAMLVGLGKAAQLAQIELQQRKAYLLELRRYFELKLIGIPGVVIFSAETERLPNTSFFSIPYYHGETLLMQLDKAGFELASGSACHSGVTEPSHVLRAMGIDEGMALNAVRVSFGMQNTFEQIDQLIETMTNLINQLPAVMRQAAV